MQVCPQRASDVKSMTAPFWGNQGFVSVSMAVGSTGLRTILLWANSMGQWFTTQLDSPSYLLKQPPGSALCPASVPVCGSVSVLDYRNQTARVRFMSCLCSCLWVCLSPWLQEPANLGPLYVLPLFLSVGLPQSLTTGTSQPGSALCPASVPVCGSASVTDYRNQPAWVRFMSCLCSCLWVCLSHWLQEPDSLGPLYALPLFLSVGLPQSLTTGTRQPGSALCPASVPVCGSASVTDYRNQTAWVRFMSCLCSCLWVCLSHWLQEPASLGPLYVLLLFLSVGLPQSLTTGTSQPRSALCPASVPLCGPASVTDYRNQTVWVRFMSCLCSCLWVCLSHWLQEPASLGPLYVLPLFLSVGLSQSLTTWTSQPGSALCPASVPVCGPASVLDYRNQPASVRFMSCLCSCLWVCLSHWLQEPDSLGPLDVLPLFLSVGLSQSLTTGTRQPGSALCLAYVPVCGSASVTDYRNQTVWVRFMPCLCSCLWVCLSHWLQEPDSLGPLYVLPLFLSVGLPQSLTTGTSQPGSALCPASVPVCGSASVLDYRNQPTWVRFMPCLCSCLWLCLSHWLQQPDSLGPLYVLPLFLSVGLPQSLTTGTRQSGSALCPASVPVCGSVSVTDYRNQTAWVRFMSCLCSCLWVCLSPWLQEPASLGPLYVLPLFLYVGLPQSLTTGTSQPGSALCPASVPVCGSASVLDYRNQPASVRFMSCLCSCLWVCLSHWLQEPDSLGPLYVLPLFLSVGLPQSLTTGTRQSGSALCPASVPVCGSVSVLDYRNQPASVRFMSCLCSCMWVCLSPWLQEPASLGPLYVLPLFLSVGLPQSLTTGTSQPRPALCPASVPVCGSASVLDYRNQPASVRFMSCLCSCMWVCLSPWLQEPASLGPLYVLPLFLYVGLPQSLTTGTRQPGSALCPASVPVCGSVTLTVCRNRAAGHAAYQNLACHPTLELGNAWGVVHCRRKLHLTIVTIKHSVALS